MVMLTFLTVLTIHGCDTIWNNPNQGPLKDDIKTLALRKMDFCVIPVLARRSDSTRRRENGNPEITKGNHGFLLSQE
jgi:hypothetical protein